MLLSVVCMTMDWYKLARQTVWLLLSACVFPFSMACKHQFAQFIVYSATCCICKFHTKMIVTFLPTWRKDNTQCKFNIQHVSILTGSIFNRESCAGWTKKPERCGENSLSLDRGSIISESLWVRDIWRYEGNCFSTAFIHCEFPVPGITNFLQ